MIDRKAGGSGGAKGTKKGARGKASPARRSAKRSGDIGRALRSAYDDALREDVPGDLLDLLGKLD